MSEKIIKQSQKPLIHIGYPKALSSWMQKLLFQPQQGFLKVMDPLAVQLCLIEATPFSFDKEKSTQWIEERLAENKSHEQLQWVLTGESLVGHTHCGGYNAKTNADRLKKTFPEGRILIIVREQKAMIRSLYKTLVVWGMPHSLQRLLKPLDANMSPQFNLDFLRYDLLVQYYQELYGKDNVLVLPYESFLSDSSEFLKRIYSFCEMPISDEQLKKMPTQRTLNKNQTLVNLLLQRWHNYFFLSGPFNYSGWFNSSEKNLKKRLVKSKKNPFPAFMDKWLEAGFSKKVSQHCQGEFIESNKNLQKITGLDLKQYGYDL